MSVDLTVPEWVENYIKAWSERLGINYKYLHISLAMAVQDDTDVRACAQVQPDINTASLIFRADIENTPEWRRTIIHELLHVVHGRLDHFTENALIPQVAESSQNFAIVAYRQYMESFIDGMADTLYWCTRWRDFPDEYPDDAPPPKERKRRA